MDNQPPGQRRPSESTRGAHTGFEYEDLIESGSTITNVVLQHSRGE